MRQLVAVGSILLLFFLFCLPQASSSEIGSDLYVFLHKFEVPSNLCTNATDFTDQWTVIISIIKEKEIANNASYIIGSNLSSGCSRCGKLNFIYGYDPILGRDNPVLVNTATERDMIEINLTRKDSTTNFLIPVNQSNSTKREQYQSLADNATLHLSFAILRRVSTTCTNEFKLRVLIGVFVAIVFLLSTVLIFVIIIWCYTDRKALKRSFDRKSKSIIVIGSKRSKNTVVVNENTRIDLDEETGRIVMIQTGSVAAEETETKLSNKEGTAEKKKEDDKVAKVKKAVSLPQFDGKFPKETKDGARVYDTIEEDAAGEMTTVKTKVKKAASLPKLEAPSSAGEAKVTGKVMKDDDKAKSKGKAKKLDKKKKKTAKKEAGNVPSEEGNVYEILDHDEDVEAKVIAKSEGKKTDSLPKDDGSHSKAKSEGKAKKIDKKKEKKAAKKGAKNSDPEISSTKNVPSEEGNIYETLDEDLEEVGIKKNVSFQEVNGKATHTKAGGASEQQDPETSLTKPSSKSGNVVGTTPNSGSEATIKKPSAASKPAMMPSPPSSGSGIFSRLQDSLYKRMQAWRISKSPSVEEGKCDEGEDCDGYVLTQLGGKSSSAMQLVKKDPELKQLWRTSKTIPEEEESISPISKLTRNESEDTDGYVLTLPREKKTLSATGRNESEDTDGYVLTLPKEKKTLSATARNESTPPKEKKTSVVATALGKLWHTSKSTPDESTSKLKRNESEDTDGYVLTSTQPKEKRLSHVAMAVQQLEGLKTCDDTQSPTKVTIELQKNEGYGLFDFNQSEPSQAYSTVDYDSKTGK